MSTSSRSREAKDVRHSTTQETISVKSSNTSSVSSVTSNSSSESESETENRPKKARGAKSNKSLKTTCGHCRKVGYKSLFFGKEKKYCCVGCSRAEGRAEEQKTASTSQTKCDKKVPVIKLEPLSSSSISMASSSTKIKTDEKRCFDWKSYLVKSNFFAAPVANFKHVALSSMWGKITIGLKLEVENTDCPNYGTSLPSFYWIATIIKTAGYMAQLRYEGFGTDDSQDFWVNMCTDDIYAVGWCATKGRPLIPPKSIESKCTDWKQYLMKRLAGTRTIPSDFSVKIEEGLNTNIQRSMKLEVVDKNRISAIRVATVTEVIGGRLHVTYENPEEKNEDFWCHERSPLIHPIGWAQLIGHELRASPEYAKQSLQKVLFRDFEPDDATWDLFMRVQNPITDLKFKEGMKLEAIDPLNLSTICVATVTKVLRNNYLMIGIDGMMAANGSDCFCYHASSPCIFPVGFCETNSIPLTPPRGYKTEFKWDEYLRQTKSTAASVSLFRKEIPDHGFTEGMYLEAVDLMEPRLICVGFVAKVVGRLLRIHFDGWEDAYDQWCDCESPDLYPIGWCQAVGYRLEPPRTEAGEDSIKKRKKVFIYKGNRKRKRGSSLGKKIIYQSGAMSSRMAEKHEESRDSSQAKSSEDSNECDSSFEKKSENSPGHDSKSSHFSFSESDPSKWTVAEVTKFLRINECGSYSHIFNEQKIDGPKFLNLTKEGLISLTGMKVGPSLKISHLIQQLKSNQMS